METITITEDKAGCWLSNSRGHYISRDVIEQAEEWGYIIDPFAKFAVGRYNTDNSADDYPFEALYELATEATEWLNSGQGDCDDCDGRGFSPKSGEYWTHKDDTSKLKRCRKCSGTGRGNRIKFQNFPPIIPDGYMWAFEDGDFGLWKYDEHGFVTDN